jgi:hypothetical protein
MNYQPRPESASTGVRREVVRLCHVEPQTTSWILTLSSSYAGCMTHYWKNRTRYCDPEGCQPHLHKLEQVWKGYAAVLRSDLRSQTWIPAVLEITEAMELDLRNRWQRGQKWKLERKAGNNGRMGPATAELLGEDFLEGLPDAFDVRPVLNVIFHRGKVVLNVTNPLPDRIYLDSIPVHVPFKEKLTAVNRLAAVTPSKNGKAE